MRYWGWAPPAPPPASLMSLMEDFVWGQPPPPPPTLTNEEGLAITVVVALICILAAVIKGCASTASPPGAKYAESPPIKGDDLIKSYTERIKESDLREAQWDTFVSAAPAETALAKTVRDHLRAAGYKIPNPRKEPGAQKQGICDSRRVVSFISQTYFDSPACCAEFCEAVGNGVEVILVSVEGSSWHGMPFPALTDVPETAQTDEGLVKPRDAAAAVFGHTIALDHVDAYLDAFLTNLGKRLGAPGEALSAGRRPRETSTDFLLGERTIRYDAFLSHKRSEAQDIVARVHDRLSGFGYRAFIDRNDLIELPSLKLAVRDTQTLVVFLTPAYFASAWCCLEFVEAVRHGVAILFIHVDGATWGATGAQFPSLSDLPETIKVEDVTIRVREAAAKVFPPAQLVEHTRSYFSPFVDALCKKLGPPPAISSIDGEAKEAWSAAGGGATVSWATLKASLAQACGSSFVSVESIIAKALGVRDAGDAGAMVTATTFAALFSQTSVKATVEAMLALSGGADAEKCVPVVVDEAGDGGLALVGVATTFADVRKQLIEAYEDDEEDDEEGDESAVRKALATGQFTFQVKGRAVKRKQETLIKVMMETLIKGREVGDPIQVVTKSGDKVSAALEGDKAAESAPATPATPEASSVDSAAAAAAAAATAAARRAARINARPQFSAWARAPRRTT